MANTTLRSFRSVPALEWSHFDLAFLVPTSSDLPRNHLTAKAFQTTPTSDLCPHAYGIQKPYYGTMQCHYTNSCKCSEFRINGLQLHFTNFRMTCMADSMCTPNPHQTQIEPRRYPGRKKSARTEWTRNPHQTHTKPTSNPQHSRLPAHTHPQHSKRYAHTMVHTPNPDQTHKAWTACAADEARAADARVGPRGGGS